MALDETRPATTETVWISARQAEVPEGIGLGRAHRHNAFRSRRERMPEPQAANVLGSPR